MEWAEEGGSPDSAALEQHDMPANTQYNKVYM